MRPARPTDCHARILTPIPHTSACGGWPYGYRGACESTRAHRLGSGEHGLLTLILLIALLVAIYILAISFMLARQEVQVRLAIDIDNRAHVTEQVAERAAPLPSCS